MGVQHQHMHSTMRAQRHALLGRCRQSGAGVIVLGSIMAPSTLLLDSIGVYWCLGSVLLWWEGELHS